MLQIYEKVLIALIFAAFGGEIIIFYLKKIFVNPKSGFSFDPSGMIERSLILILIIAGGSFILVIPIIVALRAICILGKGSFKNISDILIRKEPALEFQKIRLKSELGLSLIASPAIGILFGILATIS